MLSTRVFAELFPKIDRTITLFGRMELLHIFAQPTDNLEELYRKTSLVKYFEAHEEELSQLEETIQGAVEMECKFLDLFKTRSKEDQESNKKIDNSVYFSSKLFSKLNESKLALGSSNRLSQLLSASIITLSAAMPGILANQETIIGNCSSVSKSNSHVLSKAAQLLTVTVGFGLLKTAENSAIIAKNIALGIPNIPTKIKEISKAIDEEVTESKVSKKTIVANYTGLITITLIFYGALGYYTLNPVWNKIIKTKNSFGIINKKQINLIETSKFIRSMHDASNLINGNDELSKLIFRESDTLRAF